MKTFNYLFMVLLFLSVSNCSKDSNDDDNNSTDSNISLTIDNQTIEYSNITATQLNDKIIIGANNSDSDIQISLDSDITSGTYSNGFLISHGVNSVSVFTTVTNVTAKTLNITTHNQADKHIKGNFTLTFNDNVSGESKNSNGSFDIYYSSL